MTVSAGPKRRRNTSSPVLQGKALTGFFNQPSIDISDGTSEEPENNPAVQNQYCDALNSASTKAFPPSPKALSLMEAIKADSEPADGREAKRVQSDKKPRRKKSEGRKTEKAGMHSLQALWGSPKPSKESSSTPIDWLVASSIPAEEQSPQKGQVATHTSTSITPPPMQQPEHPFFSVRKPQPATPSPGGDSSEEKKDVRDGKKKDAKNELKTKRKVIKSKPSQPEPQGVNEEDQSELGEHNVKKADGGQGSARTLDSEGDAQPVKRTRLQRKAKQDVKYTEEKKDTDKDEDLEAEVEASKPARKIKTSGKRDKSGKKKSKSLEPDSASSEEPTAAEISILDLSEGSEVEVIEHKSGKRRKADKKMAVEQGSASSDFFLTQEEKRIKVALEAAEKLRQQIEAAKQLNEAFNAGRSINPFFAPKRPSIQQQASKRSDGEMEMEGSLAMNNARQIQPESLEGESDISARRSLTWQLPDFPSADFVGQKEKDYEQGYISYGSLLAVAWPLECGKGHLAIHSVCTEDQTPISIDLTQSASPTSLLTSISASNEPKARREDSGIKAVIDLDAPIDVEAFVTSQDLQDQWQQWLLNNLEELKTRLSTRWNVAGKEAERELRRVIQRNKGEAVHLPWTDKYRPLSHLETAGSPDTSKEFKEWLQQWKDLREGERNETEKDSGFLSDEDFSGYSDVEEADFQSSVFLLTGKTSSGKTSTVYACATELGFEVIEINSSHKRTGKYIKTLIGEATQSQRLDERNTPVNSSPQLEEDDNPETKKRRERKRKLTNGKKKKAEKGQKQGKHVKQSRKLTLLLFEDVDQLFEDEKGFISTIADLLSTSKCPIVMTAADYHWSLGSVPHTLRHCHGPGDHQLSFLLDCMLLAEGADCTREDISFLVYYAQHDLRKAVLTAQFWFQKHSCPTLGPSSQAPSRSSLLPFLSARILGVHSWVKSARAVQHLMDQVDSGLLRKMLSLGNESYLRRELESLPVLDLDLVNGERSLAYPQTSDRHSDHASPDPWIKAPEIHSLSPDKFVVHTPVRVQVSTVAEEMLQVIIRGAFFAQKVRGKEELLPVSVQIGNIFCPQVQVVSGSELRAALPMGSLELPKEKEEDTFAQRGIRKKKRGRSLSAVEGLRLFRKVKVTIGGCDSDSDPLSRHSIESLLELQLSTTERKQAETEEQEEQADQNERPISTNLKDVPKATKRRRLIRLSDKLGGDSSDDDQLWEDEGSKVKPLINDGGDEDKESEELSVSSESPSAHGGDENKPESDENIASRSSKSSMVNRVVEEDDSKIVTIAATDTAVSPPSLSNQSGLAMEPEARRSDSTATRRESTDACQDEFDINSGSDPKIEITPESHDMQDSDNEQASSFFLPPESVKLSGTREIPNVELKSLADEQTERGILEALERMVTSTEAFSASDLMEKTYFQSCTVPFSIHKEELLSSATISVLEAEFQSVPYNTHDLSDGHASFLRTLTVTMEGTGYGQCLLSDHACLEDAKKHSHLNQFLLEGLEKAEARMRCREGSDDLTHIWAQDTTFVHGVHLTGVSYPRFGTRRQFYEEFAPVLGLINKAEATRREDQRRRRFDHYLLSKRILHSDEDIYCCAAASVYSS